MSEHAETLALLRDSAAGFLAAEHSFARLRGLRDAPGGLDRRVLGKMAELGWMGLGLPETLGGAGLPLGAAAVLAEAFGAALLPEPFVLAGVMPSALVAAMPPGPAASTLAARINGGGVVAPAFAEQLNEANPANPSATVTLRGNRLVLDGRKLFVLAAADVFLVSACLEGQTVLAAVPAGVPGLTLAGQRMTDNGVAATLRLENIPLEAEAILLRGDPADRAIRRALAAGTVATSAQLAGLSAAAMDLTLSYMGAREQFGQKIGSFQALQHRAVDLRLQIELAGAGWRNAVRLYEAAPDAPATEAAISAAKARCSDTALLVGRACIQLHGAIGYTEDADIGLFMKAAMRLASSFGNGSAHRRRFFTLQRSLAA